MHFRADPEKHQDLINELLDLMKEEGFTIVAADGVQGIPRPKKLHNDGYGDQEDKAPDIYAFDEKRKVNVIGEAKTGDGDFETEHSLTQYNVFLDQLDKKTGKRTLVYVIVPASKIAEFNTLLTHYIHPDYWNFITLVTSKTHID